MSCHAQILYSVYSHHFRFSVLMTIVCKPTAVQEYNDYMSVVDKSDQLLQYYSMNRKTAKWWKKLFFHLLQVCLINAQKLYNIHRKNLNLNPYRCYLTPYKCSRTSLMSIKQTSPLLVLVAYPLPWKI